MTDLTLFEVGKEYDLTMESGEQFEGVAKVVTESYVEFELKDGKTLSIQDTGKGNAIIILKGAEDEVSDI